MPGKYKNLHIISNAPILTFFSSLVYPKVKILLQSKWACGWPIWPKCNKMLFHLWSVSQWSLRWMLESCIHSGSVLMNNSICTICQWNGSLKCRILLAVLVSQTICVFTCILTADDFFYSTFAQIVPACLRWYIAFDFRLRWHTTDTDTVNHTKLITQINPCWQHQKDAVSLSLSLPFPIS